jgi:apolipoprotein N-acyltransferase
LKIKRLSWLNHSVTLSSGWTRRFIAFGIGAAGVLALPPFGAFPFLAVTMTGAVWLIDGAVGRANSGSATRARFSAAWEAAKMGWWVGFGYFLAGLWWLGAAFLVEADQFAWALPIGVMGLPAVLAAFVAIGFGAARLLWSNNASRILALAAGVAFGEWLRSTVLTGFPWNNFGMAFGGNIILAQIASIIGLHGLTTISVGLAATPALLTDRAPRRVILSAAAALLAGIAVYGGLRLKFSATEYHSDVVVRIMQPNLQQDEKFRPEAMDRILSHYLELSARPTSQQPEGKPGFTHLVWPESPFPVLLARDAAALAKIGDFLAPHATLITGAARAEIANDRKSAKYFNSIQVLRPGGVVVDGYDKTHLVPFGEYLPFRWLFDAFGLRQFVHIPGGFEPGSARNLIRPPGFPPAAPLICYEAIFPGEVVPRNGRALGAAVLLNVTNDGWFGDTPGPRQHFAQARLRAIEEGLPLVRAANTGVSAIVDSYGRIIGSLPVGVEGVFDARLPVAAPATFYSFYPKLAPMFVWLIALMGAFWGTRSRRSQVG